MMQNNSIRGLRGYLKTDPTVLRVLSNYAASKKAEKAEGRSIFVILATLTITVWILDFILYACTVRAGVTTFEAYVGLSVFWLAPVLLIWCWGR